MSLLFDQEWILKTYIESERREVAQEVEKETAQRVERETAQRVEKETAQRVERETAQRVEKEAARKMALRLYQGGKLTVDEIAGVCGLTEDEVQKIMEDSMKCEPCN